MSDFSSYTEERIVNWMVGGEDMPEAHTNVYVALHDSDPTNDGTENEITADSYDRVETTANGDWTRTDNSFENAVEIEFPEATELWGDVSHFSLWDGPDDTDNPIAQSALESTRTIDEGDAPIFREGNLTGQVQ